MDRYWYIDTVTGEIVYRIEKDGAAFLKNPDWFIEERFKTMEEAILLYPMHEERIKFVCLAPRISQ